MSSTRTNDPSVERSRRRFERRRWSRRWVTWKYLLAAVVVAALLAGGVWAVYFSSLLAVDGVEVTGTSTLSDAQVRAAAEVERGRPLARVDVDAIRSRVESLAAVDSAEVTKHWPHEIRVDVDERVAVAVVEMGGRLRGMDEDGVVFRDYRDAPAGLPRVETPAGTGSEALTEAAHVVGALPADLATRVDHVEVRTVDQISLALRDGRTVVWGSADASDEKAEVLAALLPHEASVYDVSVPGQPTTR